MNNNFWFIIILIFFLSCKEKPERNENWIDSILLSEENILMATSLDINSLLKKSDLANNNKLSSQKKLLINAFNSSFKSSLIGINVDIPQKLFIVSKDDNSNGAIFWVGELTSKFLFKQTLKNFFEVEDFSNSNINTFYIKEYNLFISFNDYHFMVGFSPEKKYIQSKLNAYFNDNHILKNNLAITKFLKNTDDVGFYFSNKRINQLSNINNSIIASQLSNLSKINQFGNEIYVSLNFLKNDVSLNIYSYSPNQLFYKDIGVKSDFKNFISIDKKLASFGFLNLNLNQEENLFSNMSFSEGDENLLFFKILKDDQFISTLNGEISFLISDSLKYQKPKKTDISNEDDFWEDDFNESEIDFDLEIPPFLVSLGVEDLVDLINYLKKINNEFVEDESILINNSYVHLSNNILHISNKKELIDDIYNSNQLNSAIINSQFFQNPLYAELDSQLILYFSQLRNLSQFSENPTNFLNKITFTGNNNSFSILIGVMSSDENSLKSISDLILQNQFLESYL